MYLIFVMDVRTEHARLGLERPPHAVPWLRLEIIDVQIVIVCARADAVVDIFVLLEEGLVRGGVPPVCMPEGGLSC